MAWQSDTVSEVRETASFLCGAWLNRLYPPMASDRRPNRTYVIITRRHITLPPVRRQMLADIKNDFANSVLLLQHGGSWIHSARHITFCSAITCQCSFIMEFLWAVRRGRFLS